jgi:iron(III) transport system permease protein
VALLLLLPSSYLLVRALGEAQAAWEIVVRWRTLAIVGRTLQLALAVTAASMLVALPLAWLTVRTDLPLRRLWATITPLPLVIPSYVGAYLAASALGPRGLLQQLLERAFGIERLPDIHGFPGALFALTMLSYPYILLSTRGVLQRLDPALEEASRSLGEGHWATFCRVTLPQLRPALGAGGLLVALYALRDFGAVSIMRYNTFTRAIYVQYQSFDRSGAAALALVLVALTFAGLMLESSTRGRARYYALGSGATRPAAMVKLGRWRWPAFAFCCTVMLASLGLPAGVLLYWLIRGVQAGETLAPLMQATGNSVLAGTLAAACVTCAALPVALLATRYHTRYTQLLERLTYSAFALPGIVVALALVFFGSNYVPALYQTLPMLIAAYTILFIPQTFGALRATLLQLAPNLEEAARSLGRRPLQVFATITLPLLRPGLLSGAALVFLTAMVELPATLLLAPLGFKTLSGLVWSAVSEAFFARAAAPALMMVLVSSVPMAVLLLRQEHRA